VRENQLTKRFLDEANERLSREANQITELERLVFDQHAVIESIQDRYHQSENQEELLISTQLQLGTVTAENRAWQSKFHQLEENSKYLANQIDELLPQLSLKNSKICLLEDQVRAHEDRDKCCPQVVDSTSQTEVVLDPTTDDVRDSLTSLSYATSSSEKSFPKIDPTEGPHSRLIEGAQNQVHPIGNRVETSSRAVQTSSKSNNANTQSVKSISNPEKIKPRKLRPTSAPQTSMPPQPRQDEAFIPPSRNSTNHRTSSALLVSVETGTQFHSRAFVGVSEDSEIYNQSLEIYGSSLFDLVERMEGLESSLSHTTAHHRQAR
jgi:hypothetical protein